MTPRWIAVAVALLTAGCSSVLGFKDPQLEPGDAPGDAQGDAMIGAPGLDGPLADGALIDGPLIDAAIDAATGTCQPSACAFGCDPTTDACRVGNLYVYETSGAYGGNEFGGQDVPATVRATADSLCFATATTKFPARQCSRTRTHAVLGITVADSVPAMAVNYGIPDAVGVNRADDDVLVATTWNDLVDITKVPRAAVTNATGELAHVWSGASATLNAGNTCQGWTSGASTVSGTVGQTELTSSPNWLARTALTCDLTAHLLCICWAGGN